MSKQYQIKVFCCAFLLLITLYVSSSAAVEIKGTVAAVEGQRAKIEYGSEYAPNVGDKVKIGYVDVDDEDGDYIRIKGSWEIVDVGRDYAWAEDKSGNPGTPENGHLAKIQSENPQKRTNLVQKKEKYSGTKVIESVAYAEELLRKEELLRREELLGAWLESTTEKLISTLIFMPNNSGSFQYSIGNDQIKEQFIWKLFPISVTEIKYLNIVEKVFATSVIEIKNLNEEEKVCSIEYFLYDKKIMITLIDGVIIKYVKEK